YAFLDDAPLEERRTQAVYARRASEPAAPGDLGTLDAAAIEQVRDEARPDPRDADELHDALLTAGFLTEPETSAMAADLFAPLVAMRRAARGTLPSDRLAERSAIHVAAARPPEALAARPHPPLHAEPFAGRNRAGQSRGLHALPLCLAARRGFRAARRHRRSAGDHRCAGWIRARGVGLGTRDSAGATGPI